MIISVVAFSVYEMTFELWREWGNAWDGNIGMGQRVWVGDGDNCSGMAKANDILQGFCFQDQGEWVSRV